jgi:hypothetical protein
MPPKKGTKYTNTTTGETVAVKPKEKAGVIKLPASHLTPDELRARIAKQRDEAAALKEYYIELIPEPLLLVDDIQFGQWVRQYGFSHAVPALEDVAKKNSTINQMLAEGLTEDDEGKPLMRLSKLSIVKLASWIMSKGIEDEDEEELA